MGERPAKSAPSTPDFKVHFDFDQDGKTYESTLALEP